MADICAEGPADKDLIFLGAIATKRLICIL